MNPVGLVQKLKIYQRSSAGSKKRSNYMGNFEMKMIYRTTKTENAETTKKMVKSVLAKMR